MINFKSVAFHGEIPIPTEMVFKGEDPYSVQFIFHHGGIETTWDFSKELLDALEDNPTAGDGDVKFELDEGEHTLYMHLSSPEGCLTLEFDPCAVEEFLEEVNFSSELVHAEMEITDEEIYGWLGGEVA
ncbi:hypothetical protein PP459_gp043 [Streptomyces phage Wakanda]|uniref:Uncharacterized protein n=2 Tax=Wakandavirus TaxID=3044854 RepID=A0A6G8R3H7_9CAUD|nr:hypothetical protein PP459_gp043 [Streptomyces phage Wakanda]YP_010652513.1 hypothetical protein PP460_gp045 [Streptomyces phage Muntaha]QIN94190.1 hypothetical protein SEA_WAKANDA_230 [Streptomyces phage Wakanda]QIN94757.1 hypothetical protein SEA_MUNTAHA_234 [Streptomyces phage Muntaha]